MLQLSANIIVDIEEHCFSSLHLLTSLFLNSNKIQRLHPKTFTGLRKLKRLYLNNNEVRVFMLMIINKMWHGYRNGTKRTVHLAY